MARLTKTALPGRALTARNNIGFSSCALRWQLRSGKASLFEFSPPFASSMDKRIIYFRKFLTKPWAGFIVEITH